MSNINKTLFLNTNFCPTYGWLFHNKQIPGSDLTSDQLRIEEGNEIHQRARNTFPDGHLINDKNINSAVNNTNQLLSNDNINVIFEATFMAGNYITKSDILIKENNGWHLIEVKSSLNKHDEYIDDMAYTAMVIKDAGLDIKKCSLMLLSNDYKLGMNDDELFIKYDITNDVFNKVKLFELEWDNINEILNDEKPEPELKWNCKSCELLRL